MVTPAVTLSMFFFSITHTTTVQQPRDGTLIKLVLRNMYIDKHGRCSGTEKALRKSRWELIGGVVHERRMCIIALSSVAFAHRSAGYTNRKR